MATIRTATATILILTIEVTIGLLGTWDLATIGVTATASFITGGTGNTHSRNFYELAGDPKPAHLVSRAGAP